MSMNLTDIRIRMKLAGRNAAAGYTNAIIDEAIGRLFARFLRVTRCVKTSTTVAFTAATNSADFSALSGFLVGRIERARVVEDANYTDVEEDLDVVGAGDVLDRVNDDASTGTPELMAFVDSNTAKFYPTPSDNGTLTVVYSPLQTPWTLGTMGAWSATVGYVIGDVVSSGGNLYRAILSSTNVAVGTTSTWENLGAGTLVAPASVVSVIPDGFLTELIGTGGPPILQSIDPKHRDFAGPKWEDYLRFEQSCIDIGSISGNSSQRLIRPWGG